MDKIITTGQDDRLYSRLITPGPQLVKQADITTDRGMGLGKTHDEGVLAPEIDTFIKGIKPVAGKIYILVNALGAGEYYGMNLNSDWFSEDQLDPPDKTADYGYKTFLTAGVFRNHSNKDTSQSFGKVVCAAYNKKMHRVELIIEIDQKLCEQFGHSDLYDRLKKGEKLSVSMGCRVAFDKCLICKHESKTRNDYCQHCKDSMGQVLPDGRKVGVDNPKPRFFDLSIVIIGADRVSYVMSKVARHGVPTISGAELAEQAGIKSPVTRFLELSKVATQNKRAEILKQIPAQAAAVVPRLERNNIPYSLLDQMANKGSLGKVLTTSAAAGICLKPQEFQRIVLIQMGRPVEANQLSKINGQFCPNCGQDNSVLFGKPEQYDKGIVDLIKGLISDHSFFEPHVSKRITGSVKTASAVQYVDTPLLRKISAAYSGYRANLLEKISGIVATITENDVDLLRAVHGKSFEDMYRGVTPGIKIAADTKSLALLGAIPLAYLYGAHTGGTSETTHDSFIAKHPVMAMTILLGLARLGAHVSSNGQLDQFVAKLAKD